MFATRIRPVLSRQNSRVKELRAVFQHPGEQIALEGEHLLNEALRSCVQLETVFVVAGFEDRLDALPIAEETEILSLPADVFASAVTTESPQPLAALAHAPVFSFKDTLDRGNPLMIVAAGLQDPGNLGTLVRSAEAFGATGCIKLPGTTSQWNPKALRASSGSAFRLPIVDCSVEAMKSAFREYGVTLLAAVAGEAGSIADLRGPCAMMIGNEGAGLSPELVALADERITIPYPGITESLNAAIAGSILLYEAARQRGLA